MLNIEKEREALVAEIELFIAEAMKAYVVERWADSYQNTEPFAYTIDDKNEIWWMKTQAHQLWQFWKTAKAHAVPQLEGCVVVPRDQTEDWYLDPDEHMWWEADGIDGTLCYLNIGEVAAIEHKEYLITASDTLYAAIVWDDKNEDSGTWEFFKTEEEAEQAAAHCKAMVEAARGGK